MALVIDLNLSVSPTLIIPINSRAPNFPITTVFEIIIDCELNLVFHDLVELNWFYTIKYVSRLSG